MWRIKDFFINLYLAIKLFYISKFNKKLFNKENKPKYLKKYELTFEDDFNYKSLDELKSKGWRTDTYYGRRYHDGSIINDNESPDVYYSDDCLSFKNSIMKQSSIKKDITITHTGWEGKKYGDFTIEYQAGQIDSSNIFNQKYGYFEIKSKMPETVGQWPAFWLASTESWPPEIDVYETYTGKKRGKKRFESNFHWDFEPNKKMKPKGHNTINISDSFNLYAVEWTPKFFKIYFNNILVRVFSNPKALEFFDKKMHIIIGTGVDKKEGRELDKAIFPSYHQVDYVRAYKKK